MPIHATLEAQENAVRQRGAARMRLRIEAPGTLTGGKGATVVIHNLSATGMLIENVSGLKIGQQLLVALPEAPDVTATIVWRSDALAGCLFDQPLSRAALSAAQLQSPLPAAVDPAAAAEQGELLSRRLLRLRQQSGLTRAALAARTGFSAPSIWAWETGKTIPRRSSLAVLSDALGVSERELVVGTGAASERRPTAAAASAEQIHVLVDSCRVQIATLAGVEPAHVKISIEL